jgi:tight adherence protein B
MTGAATAAGGDVWLAGAIAALAAALAVLAWPGPRDALRAGLGQGRPAAAAPPAVGRRRRGDSRAALAEVLAVLDLAGAALQAGCPAERAVELAVAELPVGSPVRAILLEVRPVAEAWRRVVVTTGAESVALVARAWELSEQLGAPLAPSVATAAQVVRRSQRLQDRVETALAGPRATIRLLTALPLVGPLVGWAFGVDPVRLYWAGPVTQLATLAGLGLLLLGRLWCQALERRVCR